MNTLLTPMNLLVSTIALALGAFIAISPLRAARLWGWKHFNSLSPKRRALYLRGFRAMGLTISLAGILVAVDSVWFQ